MGTGFLLAMLVVSFFSLSLFLFRVLVPLLMFDQTSEYCHSKHMRKSHSIVEGSKCSFSSISAVSSSKDDGCCCWWIVDFFALQ